MQIILKVFEGIDELYDASSNKKVSYWATTPFLAKNILLIQDL